MGAAALLTGVPLVPPAVPPAVTSTVGSAAANGDVGGGIIWASRLRVSVLLPAPSVLHGMRKPAMEQRSHMWQGASGAAALSCCSGTAAHPQSCVAEGFSGSSWLGCVYPEIIQCSQVEGNITGLVGECDGVTHWAALSSRRLCCSALMVGRCTWELPVRVLGAAASAAAASISPRRTFSLSCTQQEPLSDHLQTRTTDVPACGRWQEPLQSLWRTSPRAGHAAARLAGTCTQQS